MKRYKYEILSGVTGTTFQVPIFLEASVDEMGVMVGFDGEFEQIEQYANFTYRGVNVVEYGYYTNSFPDPGSCCAVPAPANGTLYTNEQYSAPTLGQYVYTNAGLSSVFNGGDQYWRMRRGDGQWYAVRIYYAGVITAVTTCTPYVSPTPSITPSETPCPVNPSATPSVTPSNSIPVTPSVTPTVTITPSVTPTQTMCPVSPSLTPSVTPTITTSPSITPSISVSPSITPSISVSPSITPSMDPTITPTPTLTLTPTPTRTPTPTPTRTVPSRTPTMTPTMTPTPTPTSTPTPTPTSTPTPTRTPSPTPNPTTNFIIYNTLGSGANITDIRVDGSSQWSGTLTPGNSDSFTYQAPSGLYDVAVYVSSVVGDRCLELQHPGGNPTIQQVNPFETFTNITFNGTTITLYMDPGTCP